MNEEWNLGILRIHEGENADLDLFKENENNNVVGLRIGIIILEIKAATNLNDEHRAQVHNYSKATVYKVGLLVNFGHYSKAEHQRIIR